MSQVEIIQESSALQVEVTKEENRIKVAFSGRIDELVDLKQTWEKLLGYSGEVRTVAFDLARVLSINSVGIRVWLLFLQQVEQMFVCEFLMASEAFVELAGVIQNIFGMAGAPVRAFRAPYFCEHCGVYSSQELTADAVITESGELHAPLLKCKQCGKDLEFDGIEQEYFHFLQPKGR